MLENVPLSLPTADILNSKENAVFWKIYLLLSYGKNFDIIHPVVYK
jgi:hypothetical protein